MLDYVLYIEVYPYPLSTPLNPIFSPMSPTKTPGSGNNVLGFLMGTTKLKQKQPNDDCSKSTS